MASQEQLPPGWTSEWNQEYQRPLYVETATGRTQWEHPSGEIDPEDSSIPAQQPAQAQGKRRKYAAAQADAYYGGSIGGAAPQGFGGAAPVGFAPPQEGQFFTPAPNNDTYTQPAPVPQGGYYGGQPSQPGMSGLADQFASMNVSGVPQYPAAPQISLTTNLFAGVPDANALNELPPPIRLPAGASITNSPFANADPSYMRCTMNAFPAGDGTLKKTKLPLALIVTPFRSTKEGEEVPVITDQVIARCRRCRAYINPFVTFIEGGSRWKCCMCNVTNDVPEAFDWDRVKNQQVDRWSRAELNHSVVDHIAPTEYMVRPPQPVSYTFLIDVSTDAIQNGLISVLAQTIRDSIDRIPNDDGRSQISIIAFDSALYFFTLPSEGSDFTMMVVSDLDDVFLPKQGDLLVNIKDSRAAIDALLEKLPSLFQPSYGPGLAVGPALQAGHQLASLLGGKLVLFSTGIPSVGPGALKDREDRKLYGTTKESTLLQPSSAFYKTFAIECSRSQVSVDMFLFSSKYQDIATLSGLPRYTAGQTYFYPGFNGNDSEDARKLAHELGEVLGSPIGLEAVLRIRATRGLRMSQFHGNFFVRSSDLLAMASVPTDQSYAIEIQFEEPPTVPFVVLQAGLLYTSCYGDRRVRVITLALPTSSNISEIFHSVDQIALATFLANKAVEKTIISKLEDARDMVVKQVTDVLQAYKTAMTAGGASAQLAISSNMRMLPALALGLLKSVALRHSSVIPSDLRAYSAALLTSLPAQLIIPYLHPNFYSLHDMPEEAGTVGEQGVIMPPLLAPTSELLVSYGLSLIDNGQILFLWIGSQAVPQLLMDAFGVETYDQLQGGKIALPVLDNQFSHRLNTIVHHIRSSRRGPYWPHLYLVKETGDPALRVWLMSMFVYDRADLVPSYQQYLNTLREKVNV